MRIMGSTLQAGVNMNPQEDRIVRDHECQTLSGLSTSQRDREIKAGRFPAPFKLSTDPKTRAVGWSWLAIQKWIEQRKTATDAQKVAA